MHQLSLGKRQGKRGFTESSTSTQLTDKHQKIRAHLKSFSFSGMKCLLPVRIHRFQASITRFGCLLKKKKAAILHGDVTSARFCSSAVSAQGTQSSCLTRGPYCLPFSNNPLGIILGLGLFQLSC